MAVVYPQEVSTVERKSRNLDAVQLTPCLVAGRAMNLTVQVETNREMIAVRLPAAFHSHLSTREVSNHRSDCCLCFCSGVFATSALP